MKTTTQRDYEERILAVLVHIQGHLDHALDLDELARLAHFSPFHFHRVFRGMVGEPVKAHVRRLRLERAAYRLKAGEQSVTHIAFDAGYETHEAFTRAFRAMFEESPSGFRQLHSRLPVKRSRSGVHYAPDGCVTGFQSLNEGATTMDVRLENVDQLRVAFVRHVGPYDQVGPAWEKLMGWAGPRGLLGPNMRMLGISHDDPEITPPDKLRYDACIVVDDHVEPEGDVGVQEIAGGEYAVTTHHGPYEKFGETYATLFGQWLPAHTREPLNAPCFEAYLNNPQQTAPEDLRTDIYVPLKVNTTTSESLA